LVTVLIADWAVYQIVTVLPILKPKVTTNRNVLMVVIRRIVVETSNVLLFLTPILKPFGAARNIMLIRTHPTL
jgi:hypothetical protein